MSSTAVPTDVSDPRRSRVLALLAVSAIGFAIASVLTWEHLHPFDLPGCSKNGIFDCGTVNSSSFSEFRGIPTAFLGMVQYFLLGGLAITRLRKGPAAAGSMAYAFLFSVWGIVVSVFMFSVSETQVHALCLYCVMLYAVSVVVFGVAWSALGPLSSIGPAIKADWDGLGKQKSFAYVLAVLFLGSLAWVFSHPWANAKWYVFNPPGPQAASTPLSGDPKDIARTQILTAPYFNPGPGGAYCKGSDNPVLTLVEFGDLECPACRAASWTVDAWVDQHANEVRLCYRHYPLDMACNPEIKHPKHQYACETARAAEAAGLQGKFWNFHDAVYAKYDEKGAFINEPDLKHEALVDRAKKLGLDATQFEKDMDDQNIVDKVLDDVTMGNQVGVQSTPTYFVNGRLIAGGRDARYLDAWLDMAKNGELGPPKASSSNP